MYYKEYEEEELIGRVVGEYELASEFIENIAGDIGISVSLMELELIAQPPELAIWLQDGFIVIKEYILDVDDDEAVELFNNVVKFLKNSEKDAFGSKKLEKTISQIDAILQGKFSESSRNPYYRCCL